MSSTAATHKLALRSNLVHQISCCKLGDIQIRFLPNRAIENISRDDIKTIVEADDAYAKYLQKHKVYQYKSVYYKDFIDYILEDGRKAFAVCVIEESLSIPFLHVLLHAYDVENLPKIKQRSTKQLLAYSSDKFNDDFAVFKESMGVVCAPVFKPDGKQEVLHASCMPLRSVETASIREPKGRSLYKVEFHPDHIAPEQNRVFYMTECIHDVEKEARKTDKTRWDVEKDPEGYAVHFQGISYNFETEEFIKERYNRPDSEELEDILLPLD